MSQGGYPELVFPAGYQAECLHGPHRIQAAKELWLDWWTVDLYLAGSLILSVNYNDFVFLSAFLSTELTSLYSSLSSRTYVRSFYTLISLLTIYFTRPEPIQVYAEDVYAVYVQPEEDEVEGHRSQTQDCAGVGEERFGGCNAQLL